MKNLIAQFVQEEEGATMVEYAIMVALIAAVAIASVRLLGGRVNTTFSNTDTAIGGGTGTGT